MDKNDIFWCLTTDGLSSFTMAHPGIAFSPIENGIARFIVGKFVGLAKKRECEECIDYIIKNRSSHEEIQIAIFDLLMREYVWHMGEGVYKNKNDIRQGFRWFGNIIPLLFGKVNETRLNKYIKEMGKFFVDVYKELNKFSYVILTNLIDPYKLISEKEYSELSSLYIRDNHVRFEELLAPTGHKYEGEKFIDIILRKTREETTRYYKSHYDGYTFLSKGFKGDYADYFFSTTPDLIIGEENIY